MNGKIFKFLRFFFERIMEKKVNTIAEKDPDIIKEKIPIILNKMCCLLSIVISKKIAATRPKKFGSKNGPCALGVI